MNLRSARFAASLVSAAMLVGLAGTMVHAEPPATDTMKKQGEKAVKEGQKTVEKAKATIKGVNIGDSAPEFKLKDTGGKEHALSDLLKGGNIVVIQWFNPDCPFVKKHYGDAGNTFNAMAKKYEGKKVVLIGINSGAPGEQGAGLDRNKKAVTDWKLGYPILLDESGDVGRLYDAKRTPEMVVINKDGKVAYHGAIDDNDGTKEPGKTNYVEKAVDELLAGKPVTTATSKPYGCSVKYKN